MRIHTAVARADPCNQGVLRSDCAKRAGGSILVHMPIGAMDHHKQKRGELTETKRAEKRAQESKRVGYQQIGLACLPTLVAPTSQKLPTSENSPCRNPFQIRSLLSSSNPKE